MYLADYPNAVADYSEALRLQPQFPSAYYNLACLYSKQEGIEACLVNLERAVDLDESTRERGRTDQDLAWARQDERVRKLLSIP